MIRDQSMDRVTDLDYRVSPRMLHRHVFVCMSMWVAVFKDSL